MLGDRIVRIHRKRTVIVNRKIPLGEGVDGLYGGMLYTRSVTVSRESAVMRLPHSSLNGFDEGSIDSIIEASINNHFRDSSLDCEARPCLPEKPYDDKYGNRKY